MWTSPITQSKFPDRFFTHQNPLLWILYRKPTITDANNYWWPLDYPGKKRAINRQFSAIKYDEKFEYNFYLCFVRNHSHMLFLWNECYVFCNFGILLWQHLLQTAVKTRLRFRKFGYDRQDCVSREIILYLNVSISVTSLSESVSTPKTDATAM